MKRLIYSSRDRYDYSNIIGIGHVDSRARKYLGTLPSWVSDNLIKFSVSNFDRGQHPVSYTLVTEALEGDSDPRPVIFKGHSINDIRRSVSEYERTFAGSNRYEDEGVPSLI